MYQDVTLSAATANFIVHTLTYRKLDADALCRQAGIGPEVFLNPDSRIALPKILRLWELGIAASGDTDLPLYMGEAIPPTAIGIVAYVMMNAPTLEKALAKLLSYQDIICEGTYTHVEVRGELAYLKLVLTNCPAEAPRPPIDSELSVYVKMFHLLVGTKVELRQALFAYPEPKDIRVHRRVFGNAELLFNHSYSGLAIDKAALKLPVINADPNLFTLFGRSADAQLALVQKDSNIVSLVKQHLVGRIRGEAPGLEAVAQNLGMSVRSLQAKLKEAGTSYSQVLNELRKEIALEQLQNSRLSIADIAYLLGFAEPSVFSRSFRKWTGSTPGAFRPSAVR